MKNQKQTWLLVGLLILASTLSIISYLILTQLVAFCLQVIALIQQGGGVTFTDVISATWQTFGVKIFLPLFTLATWYVVAEFFTNAKRATMKQHAFIVSGALIVFMAVMLGLTWETFADLPMIVVMTVPAVIVAVFASLKDQAATTEMTAAVSEELVAATPTASVVAPAPIASRQGRKRSQKTKTHYRRYL